MKNKTNIYVTLHEPGLVNERIIGFLENFIFSIKRIVKKEYSIFIKGRNFSEHDYINYAKKSDIFVFILDKEFNYGDGFNKEINEIISLLSFDQENLPEYQNIFKICLDPIDEKTLPIEISSFIGYRFYDFNTRKKTDIPFDFQNDSVKYWSKMLDLVYDINESVLHFTSPEAQGASNNVYLASCSADQVLNRDDLKRELQHLGYRVLPVTELPVKTEPFKAEVQRNLERCVFIVELIGLDGGNINPGDNFSTIEIEHQLIRESMGKDPGKKRMIWIPVNQKIINQRQEHFVIVLKREEPDEDTEIIESGLYEFKNSIILRFGNRLRPTESTTIPPDSIYIITKPGTDLTKIETELSKSRINTFKLTTDKTKNLYKQHLQYLNQADGLMVYNPDNDINWLTSKIRDIIKSLGQGRIKPYKGICLIMDSSPDLEYFQPWMPEVEQFKTDDMHGLIGFFNKIKG